MDLEQLTHGVRDAAGVKRVFGDPYEVEGVVMIPVARSMGGGGGGHGPNDQGSGGGFGFGTTPAGVYVIKDGDVRFVPVVDLNGLAARAAVVLVTGVLAWRSVARARQHRKTKVAKYRS